VGAMTVETKTVWVEELACCGEPFAVGSTVTWDLHSIDAGERRFLTSVFGADIGANFTDGYERHGGSGEDSPVRPVAGIVRSIGATTWRIHPLADDSPETDALGLYALPGSVRIVAQSAADSLDRVEGGECFGYIVELEVPA
jgi:uncharacterized protein DUF6578